MERLIFSRPAIGSRGFTTSSVTSSTLPYYSASHPLNRMYV